MNNTISIDSALNPVQGKTRFGERPLSNRELLQRQAAVCATSASKPTPTCTGCLFIGMFFDGTGNNEDIDYKQPDAPRKRKHTNVVRLYHAHRFPAGGRHQRLLPLLHPRFGHAL